MNSGYIINRPTLTLTIGDIKRRLAPDEFKILMCHATCLACLDGNAFGDEHVEQYCLDAYVNLWQNSNVGDGHDLPNLYECTAVEFYIGRRETPE